MGFLSGGGFWVACRGVDAALSGFPVAMSRVLRRYGISTWHTLMHLSYRKLDEAHYLCVCVLRVLHFALSICLPLLGWLLLDCLLDWLVGLL